MKIHIVDGVRRRNPLRRLDFRLTRQYWYPVVLAKQHLRDKRLFVDFFEDVTARVLDCDVLILSSRQHDHLFSTGDDPAARADSVERIASAGRKLLWFDMRDSSGTPQFEVLPFVDLYVKQCVLRDLSLYERPLYGGRVFSDYYHNRFSVSDAMQRRSDDQEEAFTLLDRRWSEKVVVGWDMSYDYRRHWTGVTDQVCNSLQECCRLIGNGPPAIDFHPPGGERDYDLAVMLSVGRYLRDSVAFQRRLALDTVRALSGNVFVGKVPRSEFVATLRNSKLVLSCFGNGEVCYREHEAWVAGAAVIMPDMGHLRTWPDRYRDGETYKAVDWDLRSLPAAFDELMADPALRERLAINGQLTLRRMFSEGGLSAFANRFETLVRGLNPDQAGCSAA